LESLQNPPALTFPGLDNVRQLLKEWFAHILRGKQYHALRSKRAKNTVNRRARARAVMPRALVLNG
jgi:hypothetical protein